MSNDLGFSRGMPSAQLNGMETGPYLVSTYYVTSSEAQSKSVMSCAELICIRRANSELIGDYPGITAPHMEICPDLSVI